MNILLLALLAGATAFSLSAAETAPKADAKTQAKAKPQAKARKAPQAIPADGGLKLATTAAPRMDPAAENKTSWHKYYDNKRKQIARYKNDVQILFLGDSITHFWNRDSVKDKRGIGGSVTFKKYFSKYRLVNLGYAGDRTRHTLWIINDSKLLDNIKPQLVVLMIGTNNLGFREATPQATAEGIKTVVAAIRTKLPEAHILLFGVFPRAEKPDHFYRKKIKTINNIICTLADGKNITYCDITDKLLEKDGTLSRKVMPDLLHPAELGYEVWAQAIMPGVSKFVDKK